MRVRLQRDRSAPRARTIADNFVVDQRTVRFSGERAAAHAHRQFDHARAHTHRFLLPADFSASERGGTAGSALLRSTSSLHSLLRSLAIAALRQIQILLKQQLSIELVR